MDKITTPCAACKYSRRKCTKDCVLAPYFPTNNQANYEAVHKVFGARRVATLLNDIHPIQREHAAKCLVFEAQACLFDPVNGCTGIIYELQRQVNDLHEQLEMLKKELASYNIFVPAFEPPPPITYQQIHHNPTIYDEAQRIASAQTAQMQQTQEAQTHHNEKADKKMWSKI